MFDKLDDILMRLEEVLNQLSEPDVAADAAKFQKLMKEQAELQPIAAAAGSGRQLHQHRRHDGRHDAQKDENPSRQGQGGAQDSS